MYKRAKYYIEQLTRELDLAEYWEKESTAEFYSAIADKLSAENKKLKEEVKELELKIAQQALEIGKLLGELEVNGKD